MRARLDRVERAAGDADIGDDQHAAQRPPRQQQMPGLLAEEGDGERGTGGGAAHRAARAIEAARHVDGHGRDGARRDRLDHGFRGAVEWAREAGAEDRVDHQAGAVEKSGRERLDRSGP